MPDAKGNFKGAFINAKAWERIFGVKLTPETCQHSKPRTALDYLENGCEPRKECKCGSRPESSQS